MRINSFEANALEEALVLTVFGVCYCGGPVALFIGGIHVSHDNGNAVLCIDYSSDIVFHGLSFLEFCGQALGGPVCRNQYNRSVRCLKREGIESAFCGRTF